MQPRIETSPEKKLIGKRIRMSIAQNRTQELWQGFMQRRNEISNTIGTDMYSMRVYSDAAYFSNFNPTAEFDKWAAIEVTDFGNVPDGFETLTIPEGLYAIFPYKGAPSAAGPFYQHIYATWLPASGYRLDNRPHFEIMGAKYKGEHPDSEEDVWVPILNK
jgi:AraC family transcriptional regulator